MSNFNFTPSQVDSDINADDFLEDWEEEGPDDDGSDADDDDLLNWEDHEGDVDVSSYFTAVPV